MDVSKCFIALRRRVSPALLLLNTFGLQLLAALCVGVLPAVIASGLQAADAKAAEDHSSPSTPPPLAHNPHPHLAPPLTPPSLSPRQYQQLVRVGLLTQLCARALVTLIVVLCATVLHGHILVWAIIAPRFVFEICMAATAAVAAMLLALLG